MFKVRELNNCGDYIKLTFTDRQEVYGALIIVKEEGLYMEFMEFDGDELRTITDESSPDEFKRLEEKYLDNIIKAIS